MMQAGQYLHAVIVQQFKVKCIRKAPQQDAPKPVTRCGISLRIAAKSLFCRSNDPQKIASPARNFAPRTKRMLRQFPPAREAQRRLAKSQMDTKRFGNLGQGFPCGSVTVTPVGAARQLVKNFRACFWCGLGRKLILEVFYQLQALESA